MTNRPGDLAPLISMLKGERTTPEEFEQRFVRKKKVRPSVLQRLLYGATTGEEEEPANVDELKQMLEGHIDYHAPLNSVVPVGREDVHVEMGPEQSRLYHAMWKRLPLVTRWKLQRDFPLSSDELLKLRSFLSGPRQVSLSTYPYLRKQDPMRAFKQSPKLQAAYGKLQETLKDDRSKALVFSNFIDAGLVPYSAALQKNNIPHALFHGGLNDAARKKLVEDFNTNKLRVALLGPSGTEGLSFKGTQAVQLLDGHFHPVRGKQSEGRALRFDSHEGLPEELRQVNVQRFFSRLPPGMAERFKALIMRRSPRLREGTDDHLEALAKRKGKLNEKFMEILKEVGQPQA
jgi:SNF2 family DNA or RNA helicase